MMRAPAEPLLPLPEIDRREMNPRDQTYLGCAFFPLPNGRIRIVRWGEKDRAVKTLRGARRVVDAWLATVAEDG